MYNMEICEILSHWNIESGEVRQLQESVWETAGKYVVKAYEDRGRLERNVQFMKMLRSMDIPAAEVIPDDGGEDFFSFGGRYYLLTRRLPGSRNEGERAVSCLAYVMGETLGKLHLAFQKCEAEMEFWDNSLLDEMKGWVKKNLIRNGWRIISEVEYEAAVSGLASVSDRLPFQLIHRDVHFGNFLFQEGKFTGYIDFDLSQRNIRVFDLCYFLMGLLAEKDNHLDRETWLRILSETAAGYESQVKMTDAEKEAFPWVMESIEILFAAWSAGNGDMGGAEEAARLFRFVRENEAEVRNAVGALRL